MECPASQPAWGPCPFSAALGLAGLRWIPYLPPELCLARPRVQSLTSQRWEQLSHPLSPWGSCISQCSPEKENQ